MSICFSCLTSYPQHIPLHRQRVRIDLIPYMFILCCFLFMVCSYI